MQGYFQTDRGQLLRKLNYPLATTFSFLVLMKLVTFVLSQTDHFSGHHIKYFVFFYSTVPLTIEKSTVTSPVVERTSSAAVSETQSDGASRSLRGKRTKSVSMKKSLDSLSETEKSQVSVKSQLKRVEANVCTPFDNSTQFLVRSS